MSIKRPIVVHTLLMSTTAYFQTAISFISGIILRKTLGASLFGNYHFLTAIVESYAAYSNMGVLRGYEKEAPSLASDNNGKRHAAVDGTARSFLLLSSVTAGFAWCLFVLFFTPNSSPTFYPSLVFAVSVICRPLYNYALVKLRTKAAFRDVSIQAGMFSILTFCLSASGAVLSGLSGAITGYAVSLLAVTVLAWRSETHLATLRLDLTILRSLMLQGLTLTALTLTEVTFLSIDRMLIARFHDSAALGVYSVAVMAFGLGMTIPNQLGIVLWPRLLAHKGNHTDIHQLTSYLVWATKLMALLAPVTAASLYLLLPIFVQRVLPDYSAGILPLRILMLGLPFHSVTVVANHCLVALNREISLIGIKTFAMLATLASAIPMLRQARGVEAVAVSMTVGMIAHQLAVFALSAFALAKAGTPILRSLGSSALLPLAFLATFGSSLGVSVGLIPTPETRAPLDLVAAVIFGCVALVHVLRDPDLRSACASIPTSLSRRLR